MSRPGPADDDDDSILDMAPHDVAKLATAQRRGLRKLKRLTKRIDEAKAGLKKLKDQHAATLEELLGDDE